MAVAELNDITEQSSKEDVTAYAEQVAKEVEEERAGETSEQDEQKSDAQIASEHAGAPANNETSAETESGSDTASEGEDTAEVEDQSEDTGNEGASWLDDDLKAEIAAYGIEESELADFASRDELERALRLFDKSALDAGRKALAESASEDDKGQSEKKPKPKADHSHDTGKKDGEYEVTLPNEELWDEDIAKGVKEVASGLRDQLVGQFESRFAELEAQLAEAGVSAEEQHLDSLIDSLGHADLFGKTDKETPKQLQRREDLIVAAKAQQIGLERLGRPTKITESSINRVARMVFAEELGKKDLKKRTRKISNQSNSRQGGGVTRPQDPREDPRDEADRLYKELDRG